MGSERVGCLLALVLSSLALAEPMVGVGVGNADAVLSEASRLYNKKQYVKAGELFLKATRIMPGTLPAYLQLARVSVLARQLQRGCYAYRVFLKASPDTPDRKKAQAESEQCERQLKVAKGQPADPTPRYVEGRASFFSQLDKGQLLGPGGAAEELRGLVQDGLLGPELGDMAQKLGAAAKAQAEAISKRALGSERVPAEVLRTARPLFQIAADVGHAASSAGAETAFLDGLAELSEGDFRRATQLFSDAARADPANKEYVFYRALALYQAGERLGALKVLEAELKDDPRTAVLRASMALATSPDVAAFEIERLLFSTRFPPEK